MSYSQSREEEIVLGLLGERPPGLFLDIGASNGVLLSNTRALYERGWKGMLVEGSPLPFGSLIETYRADKAMVLVGGVVTPYPESGLKRFHVSADVLSTTEEAFRKQWEGHTTFRECWVPTVSITEVLAFFATSFGRGPDLVSIDTEGTSWASLKVVFPDLARMGAEIIIVETDDREATKEAAAAHGYVLGGETHENYILKRKG